MSITREHRLIKRSKSGEDLVVNMAFASAQPYERWWGIEVLDVAGARLGRLNDGAPVLFNHNWNDLRGVHVPGSVRADKDGVLRGDIRLSAATQAGRDAIALVESDILTKASVGYEIHKVIEISAKKSGDKEEREIDGRAFRTLISTMQTRDGQPLHGDLSAFRREIDRIAGGPIADRAEDQPTIYKVVDWEPIENSLVTVPADPTVGVGRQAEGAPQQVTRAEEQVSQPAAPAASIGVAIMADQIAAGNPAPAASVVVTEDFSNRPSVAQLEQSRQQAIRNLAKSSQCDDRYVERWIREGTSLERVADDMMEIQKQRGDAASKTFLDMPKKDVANYSITRALRAASSKDWTKAGLELEANKELCKRLNRLPKGDTSFFVPLDAMMRQRHVTQQTRDMTVAGVSGSNYLVSTDNQAGSFIDLLRNTSVTLRMGITRLSGLQGNVTIPKMTAGNTAYWLADENTQITESQPTIGQLSLTPKNVAAMTELSHLLMQQSSPDVEQLVMDSIARDIALAVDVGVIRGSGNSGQPLGIVGTGSIGAFTGGSLAAAGLLDAQADVAASNALMPTGCGYVTTPAVAALLMARPELPTTGTTRMWTGNMREGGILGFPAMSSAQMATATMLFGWWPSVVLAEWGVLELMVNPFSDFTRGLTAVRGWYTCDVGVRYPGAFSYSSSIT